MKCPIGLTSTHGHCNQYILKCTCSKTLFMVSKINITCHIHKLIILATFINLYLEIDVILINACNYYYIITYWQQYVLRLEVSTLCSPCVRSTWTTPSFLSIYMHCSLTMGGQTNSTKHDQLQIMLRHLISTICFIPR